MSVLIQPTNISPIGPPQPLVAFSQGSQMSPASAAVASPPLPVVPIAPAPQPIATARPLTAQVPATNEPLLSLDELKQMNLGVPVPMDNPQKLSLGMRWLITVVTALLTFIVIFLILWFTSPIYFQRKDAAGSPTGQNNVAIIVMVTLAIALIIGVICFFALQARHT